MANVRLRSTLNHFSTRAREGKLDTFMLLGILRKVIIVKTRGRMWKRQVTIKARDAVELLGYGHAVEVHLGRLLRKMWRMGLIKQANTSRPRGYILSRSLILWAYLCNYPYCTSDSSICGLYGLCPHHKLLGEDNGNGD